MPLEIKPLTDQELMGIPREQVLLTLPWSAQVVSRDPAVNAANATVKSAEVSGAPDFDRITFEFGADTDFPGYRIVWNDTTNARCGDEKAADLGTGRTLLIRLQPAWAHVPAGRDAKKTTPTIAKTSLRPALPSITTARQLCDGDNRVVWALSGSDSTVFRVVELHTPPRLVVDVAHPSAGASAGLVGGTPRDTTGSAREN